MPPQGERQRRWYLGLTEEQRAVRREKDRVNALRRRAIERSTMEGRSRMWERNQIATRRRRARRITGHFGDSA